MSVAIIFDLDGTLTLPHLDFDAIRSELGIAEGPVLEAMAHMQTAQRLEAERVLERHEKEAAHASVLYDGATDTLAELRRRGHPIAILTRNARRWVDVVLQKHGLCIDAVRCRDDGAVKPSAGPLVDLCAELSCDPGAGWMVGDYLFDIQSGKAAGCTTVLMAGDRPLPDFAEQADHVIRRLPQLLDLIP